MKILMLSIDRKMFEEGSVVRARMQTYAAAMPADEFHIIVYTKPEKQKEQIAPNMWIYPTNTRRRPLYFKDGLSIARSIVQNKGKEFLIISQEGMTNLLALLCKLLFGCTIEVQIHTDFLNPAYRKESFTNFIRCILYYIGVRWADSVRVVSERAEKQVRRIAGGRTDKVYTLPLFVDIKRFTSHTNTETNNVSLPHFNHTLLMVGRIMREKNYPLAIAVLREVRKTYPDTGLLIVGEGDEQKTIEAMLIPEEKEFIVFSGQQSDLVPYYQHADVFLHTADYEGYGLVFIEAAASGIPIVSTDVGIMNDVLVNGRDALIGPSDAKVVATQVETLFNDPAYAQSLAASAKSAIEKHAYKNFDEYLTRYAAGLRRAYASAK
jgi:glycosyltransferase involved in cell wall biosynthesis